jgi:hypothetical protein
MYRENEVARYARADDPTRCVSSPRNARRRRLLAHKGVGVRSVTLPGRGALRKHPNYRGSTVWRWPSVNGRAPGIIDTRFGVSSVDRRIL